LGRCLLAECCGAKLAVWQNIGRHVPLPPRGGGVVGDPRFCLPKRGHCHRSAPHGNEVRPRGSAGGRGLPIGD
jgi:hypothetical protein